MVKQVAANPSIQADIQVCDLNWIEPDDDDGCSPGGDNGRSYAGLSWKSLPPLPLLLLLCLLSDSNENRRWFLALVLVLVVGIVGLLHHHSCLRRINMIPLLLLVDFNR